MKWQEWAIIPALGLVLLAISYYHYQVKRPPEPPLVVEETLPKAIDKPDFSSYVDVKQKKHDFFQYMLPLIQIANNKILKDRHFVLTLTDSSTASTTVPTEEDKQRLVALWRRNRLPGQLFFGPGLQPQLNELLLRIDMVPAALILAQSANESAWGTSRFATEANNFFGIWCFSKGCGLKPRLRDEGLHHEVASFKDVQSGLNRYMHTINSHSAYKKLRQIRGELRGEQKDLSGTQLARGLSRYSERGQDYVEEIQAMISYNKLEEYNRDLL